MALFSCLSFLLFHFNSVLAVPSLSQSRHTVPSSLSRAFAPPVNPSRRVNLRTPTALVATSPPLTVSSTSRGWFRWLQSRRGDVATRGELTAGNSGSAQNDISGSDQKEVYWKDGHYTNWTYGALLDQKKDPPLSVVGSKMKNIVLSMFSLFMAVFKQIAKTMFDPMRVPRGIGNSLKHLKDEIIHYADGFKLFCADVSTAWRLFKAFIKSGKLTRREKRQLQRTAADVLRVVPMGVFLLVPFFEFLLPLALKIFPEMLPSQFQKKYLKENNLKKEFKVRLRTAAFLQTTLNAIAKAKDSTEDDQGLAALLADVRAGKRVSNADIRKIAHLFDDEITLDNLEHIQMAAMCRMLGLRPYGASSYLRWQLLNKLKALKKDDLEIAQEGVDVMSVDELKAACRERGMRTLGLTEAGYRRNLRQWVSLSTKSEIPATLLLLSRTFTILERNPNPEELLRVAISKVDESTVKEIMYEKGVTETPKSKLEVIAAQNKLIEEDREEEIKTKAKNSVVAKVLAEKQEAAGDLKEEAKQEEEVSEKNIKIVALELDELIDDPFTSEREILARLKEADDEMDSVPIDGVKTIEADINRPMASRSESDEDAKKLKKKEKEKQKEKKKVLEERLRKRVDAMLEKMEKRLELADKSVGERLNLLDKDHDGNISEDELISVLTQTFVEFEEDPEAAAKVAKSLKKRCGNWRGQISVSELHAMAREYRQREDEDDVNNI